MSKLALTFATCGLLLGSASHAKAASYAPKIGERHPDFTLPAIGGRFTLILEERCVRGSNSWDC